MFRAIRVNQFGDPSVLKLEHIPLPPVGPTQVMLEVKAIGVNPVDTYKRNGGYARPPPLPYTPGDDCCGVVAAVGEKVSLVKLGDRVFTSSTLSGSYAERSLCEETNLIPLPQNVSFEEGAGIYVAYATAYRALFQRGRAQKGETVLVHGGSGGVGLAAIQFAKQKGLQIIATASTEHGRDLVKANGATYALDHSKEGYLDEVMKLTEGKGVDIILEMLANVNLGKDLTVLNQGGRVLVIGSRGTVEVNPRDLMSREADVLGVMLFKMKPEEAKELKDDLVSGLQSGELKPVVGKKFKLSEAPQAHEEVIQGSHSGKIILVPE
eukprot:TRINITY_DN1750_c0_g3_i3.p1 TRINITY_DN1750_c0_g3~~TRINITY_DN1750_c0_g3_i3.p1  ORF type:complete len:323 (-),score=95.20 TRINITY_DN1750_c0_g3_i3:33-1001(-)